MSFEWPLRRLGDHCQKIGSGSTPRGGSETYLEKGIFALFRSQNIYNDGFKPNGLAYINDDQAKKLNSVEIKINDILLNITGDSAARVCLAPSKYLPARVNQHVSIIRPIPNIFDSRFVRYFLASPLQQNYMLGLAAAGGTRNALTKGMIEDFTIPCPPIKTQKEIADILTSLDDRIDLLRETNKTLEAIAQAIFKSWFVDFDPVRAKQEGREPEGMDAETAALFPDSFEESELGLIPKGWEVKKIGEVSEILNGYAFKSEDYVNEDDGVFVLRTTNFSDSGFAIRLDKDVFLPKPFLRTHEKYLCEPFDFHLVMVGASVGRTSTLLPHMLPALRNQNMWCFRTKNGFLSKFFIHEMVKNLTVEALRSTSGSAREFLTKGIFVKKSIIIPSQKLISIFEDKVSTLKNKIAVNENQSILLMGIRDTMLPRLISGQLRLPDAESMVEEAIA